MSKKYIIVFFTFISLTLVVFYYSDSSDVKQTTKKIQNVLSKDITLNIEQKEKSIKKEAQKVAQEEIKQEISVLDQTSYIGSARDSTQRYTISFTMNKTLLFPMTTKSEFAIPFIGEIEHNTKVSNFTISLIEKYMSYQDDIKLEIADIKTKKQAQCDMNFIGELKKDTNYKIKLDYSEDYLECSLISSEPMSEQTLNMKKKMSKPIKLSDLPPEVQKRILENFNKNK